MFISPAVVGAHVVIGSCAGSFYSLDRASGTPSWLYDATAESARPQFHGEPLLLGQTIVVPSDADDVGYLYAFDATSGNVRWKVGFRQGVATTPVLAGERMVVVSKEGEVASIQPRDGRVAWKVSPAGVLAPLPFVQSPAAAGGRIFVADNLGKLFALDAADGQTLWTTSLGARANTGLVVIGKTVVVGTADGQLQWIDTSSGAIENRMRLGGLPYGTLIDAAPLLFVLAQGATSQLLALDSLSGELRWKQETPKEWTTFRPLVTGAVIIAGSEEKEVCAFDRAGGAKRWCRAVGPDPAGSRHLPEPRHPLRRLAVREGPGVPPRQAGHRLSDRGEGRSHRLPPVGAPLQRRRCQGNARTIRQLRHFLSSCIQLVNPTPHDWAKLDVNECDSVR